MNLRECLACVQALWRCRGYRPQPLTRHTFARWISQFDQADRPHILRLLKAIRYISEREMHQALVNQNGVILRQLADAGVGTSNIIYVQVHDAGSSSPVMLNALRDLAGLERQGCHFVDSKDVLTLNKLTNELEEGAIVYVDDFAGTGNQFGKVRKFLGEYIIWNFSEFLLVVGACEEAVHQLGRIGVQPVMQFLHAKADRPLHPSSTILAPAVKNHLCKICEDIAEDGLGYMELATMIVFYRNAPNTLPRLFRGSKDQSLRKGLFPRFDDLPIPNGDDCKHGGEGTVSH